MSDLPGLRFKETMWGYFSEGLEDFEEGYKKGEESNNKLQFWVTIDIENIEDFIKISGRKANLTGKISCSKIGKNLEITKGEFNLFQTAQTTGERRMTYEFYFAGNDDKRYYLEGYKIIYHNPGKIDVLEDITTLFIRIYRVINNEMKQFGSGILKYNLTDLPTMITSMKVTKCKNLIDQIKVKFQFFSFIYGEIRDTYLHDLSPFYYTAYENLVLSGCLTHESELKDFFFFSGIHDKDFPWGDKATFWDIALLIKDGNENYKRYVLTNYRIENLILNITNGIFSYEGEIFEISEGYRASFSQMRKSTLNDSLKKCKIKIDLKLNVNPFTTQDMPFPLISNYKRHIKRPFMENIQKWQSDLNSLGLHLTPYRVTIEHGQITLQNGTGKQIFEIVKDKTLGEAEISSFQNIKWPILYYNYFCGINSASDTLRLHIRTDLLKKDRQEIFINKIEEELGKIIDQVTWLDLEIKDKKFRLLTRKEGDEFPVSGNVLLEINNDHYPTAVFQRRIVELQNNTNKPLLALEENVDILNLGSINSDRESIVVVVKDSDKFKALDQVLEKSIFFNKLEATRKENRKDKGNFSIIIKPNFMFMYSLNDRTTFTDPELIEYLISRIWEKGYTNITVAEARCTYGTFFTNREVSSVANYIGLDGICPDKAKYRIVDLSLNSEEYEFKGKLGKHIVNKEWKNSDFRISFAKNKTHSYAFYTLTLKNIYGALPKENKFKEYHCERDIFSTTIEYLKQFPVHFGFIDAYISADGPFGIFADKDPNITETIIGGDDLVAVDWIGAAKMGLNPMISEYMKLAVEEFGKPQINLLGDRTVYHDWVNVSDVVSNLAFTLDREYYFGNFLYSIFNSTDPYFKYKEKSTLRRVTRVFNKPLRELFFENVRKGKIDPKLNKKLYRRYSGEKLKLGQ